MKGVCWEDRRLVPTFLFEYTLGSRNFSVGMYALLLKNYEEYTSFIDFDFALELKMKKFISPRRSRASNVDRNSRAKTRRTVF